MISINKQEARVLKYVGFATEDFKVKRADKFDNVILNTKYYSPDDIAPGRLHSDIAKWVLSLGYVQFLGLLSAQMLLWGSDGVEVDSVLQTARDLFNKIEVKENKNGRTI